jgi:hypothetical protein
MNDSITCSTMAVDDDPTHFVMSLELCYKTGAVESSSAVLEADANTSVIHRAIWNAIIWAEAQVACNT